MLAAHYNNDFAVDESSIETGSYKKFSFHSFSRIRAAEEPVFLVSLIPTDVSNPFRSQEERKIHWRVCALYRDPIRCGQQVYLSSRFEFIVNEYTKSQRRIAQRRKIEGGGSSMGFNRGHESFRKPIFLVSSRANNITFADALSLPNLESIIFSYENLKKFKNHPKFQKSSERWLWGIVRTTTCTKRWKCGNKKNLTINMSAPCHSRCCPVTNLRYVQRR